ncbi:MAG TPA: hypothetical protein VFH52_09280, partial [Rhodanobacteraceae bacterium]|nr:hypothetical protein [Rhodanobacteraceae bacterium]
MKVVPLMVMLSIALLAGCAPNTRPDNHALEREAIAGTQAPPPPPVSETQFEPLVQSAPEATTTIGTGSFIN